MCAASIQTDFPRMKIKDIPVIYFFTPVFIQIRVYMMLAWHAGWAMFVHRGYWLDEGLVLGNHRLTVCPNSELS
jgi:hypothetical protein